MKTIRRKLGLYMALLLMITMIMPSTVHAMEKEEKVNVLILFDHQPGHSEEAIIRAFGGEIKYTYNLIPTIAATVPTTSLKGLRNNPNILTIEEDVTVTATEEIYDWGVSAIEADLVHQGTSFTGTGIKVAVVDTGIAFSHPDLPDAVLGYNAIKATAEPIDDNGHGTHVAGTIAATIGNQIGVAGIAPDVTLYAVKVLDRKGSGYISDIIEGIQWCVNNNIDIANNSYGSSLDPGVNFKLAYQNAEQSGVLLVGAAGNSGLSLVDPQESTVIYPAAYDSVMAVAAVDQNFNRAYFSSVGPAVEISAPGVNILSTYLRNSYSVLSGTSMAAPHVTGVAALLMEQGDYTSPMNVRDRLNVTADNLGVAGRDTWYGNGFVRADKALAVGSIIPEPEPNTAPVIEIQSPLSESVYDVNETVLVVGSATDAEDGNLSEEIVWYIEETGETFTGSSFDTSFTAVGDYTLVAEVTDTDGLNDTSQVMIHINDSQNQVQDIMKVESVGYAHTSLAGGKINKLFITVSIVDEAMLPVENAVVEIEVQHEGVVYAVVSGITNLNGEVEFSFNKVPLGTYIVGDINATHSDYVLDKNTTYINEGITIS